jgi:hypothetical protein
MKNTFNLRPRDLECIDHPMHINWDTVDHAGNPALCCSICVSTTKGSRRGKPRYIRFIKTKEIKLLQDMNIDER